MFGLAFVAVVVVFVMADAVLLLVLLELLLESDELCLGCFCLLFLMVAAPPAAVLLLLSLFLSAAALVFLWKGRGGVVISTCSIDSDIASLVRGEVSKAEDMKRVRLSPDGGVILECGGDGGVCDEVEVLRAEEELLLFDDDSAAARDDSIGGGRATTSTPS